MQKQRKSLAVTVLLMLVVTVCTNGMTLHPLLSGDDKKGCGQEGVTDDCCKPPEAGKDVKQEYCYDARGSQDAFDIPSHRKWDKIRIIIKNKNPFLYTYTVTVKSEVVAEPALGAFLPLLSDFIGSQSQPSETDKKDRSSEAVTSVTPAIAERSKARAEGRTITSFPPHCNENSLKVFDSLVTDQDRLKKDQEALKDRLDPMKKERKKVEEDYKKGKAELEKPQQACDTLCKTARNLLAVLRGYNVDMSFEKAATDLKEAAKAQEKALRQFQKNNPGCQTEFVEIMIDYASTVADTIAEKYLKDFNEIANGKKTLDEAANTISTILSSADSFTQAIEIGPFRVPTDVSIKVERKLKTQDAKDTKSETIIDAKANFGGGQRFVLAGGLAFTNLQKQEFQRVQPASGDPIIGLKENSNKRIVPLVMLHTRIWEFNKSIVDGFHLSVGVTGKNDNKGTDIEYLLGPSISFAEERLFITGGAYAGKQQRLEGGFQLGSTLPMSVAEIPVRKEYHWKFGVSVSFKIK